MAGADGGAAVPVGRMPIAEPSFTVGIEEEYLLVDPETRDLAKEPPASLMAECESALGDHVSPEFLKSQIEVQTGVCGSIAEARNDLAGLRGTVARVAGRHGLAIMAASTHPFAAWRGQVHADKERYVVLAQDMQVLARRLLICGMHVHVGIDDDDLRIDFLGQIPYLLPHLLALSTSSPFWEGEETGLKSYRLSVFDELPRAGPPEMFDSYQEYERSIAMMVDAGLLEDASKIWWDVRPSARFPTLEMRITDMCPRIEDTICIAALYRCVCRMLYRLRRENKSWRRYSRLLVNENRWRAQRYGTEEGLVDFGRGTVVGYRELLEELLAMVAEDAAHFDCADEVAHARRILARGTSADRQIARYREAVAGGASHEQALHAVVDMLLAETVEGL